MNCIFFVHCFALLFIVPSKPLNLTVLEVTSTTITIGWRDPENLNGAIVGYRVFYIHQNQTYFATVRSGTGAGEMIRYDLCDLSKYIYSYIHFVHVTHFLVATCGCQATEARQKIANYLVVVMERGSDCGGGSGDGDG